jgi:hypothetical protein
MSLLKKPCWRPTPDKTSRWNSSSIGRVDCIDTCSRVAPSPGSSGNSQHPGGRQIQQDQRVHRDGRDRDLPGRSLGKEEVVGKLALDCSDVSSSARSFVLNHDDRQLPQIPAPLVGRELQVGLVIDDVILGDPWLRHARLTLDYGLPCIHHGTTTEYR